jgi:hypothetical protein
MAAITNPIIDFGAAHSERALLRRRAELARSRAAILGRFAFCRDGVVIPGAAADFSGFRDFAPATVTELREKREHSQGA